MPQTSWGLIGESEMTKRKYKLNTKLDVDVDGYGDDAVFILNLPYGFRFSDDVVHVRGYDTMIELRMSAKNDVIPCNCTSCVNRK